MTGSATDVQNADGTVAVAGNGQLQRLQEFAAQVRFRPGCEFTRVVASAKFEKQSLEGIAEPSADRGSHHSSMLTNVRGVSSRIYGQREAVRRRSEPQILAQQPTPGSHANWSRKDREDREACRREQTNGTDPPPASAAQFRPVARPYPRNTCANPTPAARNYFRGLSRKAPRGSRAGIGARRARSKRPEESDGDSGRYKCHATWPHARGGPRRWGWPPATARRTLR